MTLLPLRESGVHQPALILMHFLGGSAREWDEVRNSLDPIYRCIAIDLPGFGDAAEIEGFTVLAMAEAVAQTVAALKIERFILVGHSMSGKVAAVLARRAADGHLPGLGGLILVAPSPPSPEPMPDDKRNSMLAALAEPHDDDEARANSYISKNESRTMPPDIQARAVADVLRMNRAAWAAWLTSGSREDWASPVATLHLPVLIVCGETDTSLGEDAQRRLTLPHFTAASLVVVPNSGHLIPMEKPAELAALMQHFLIAMKVPADYLKFIESDRVAPNTREVLLARIPDPNGPPQTLTPRELDTLRALLSRVIPQNRPEIDLAARIDCQLATGKADGWRFANLPPDAQAYKLALGSLNQQALTFHGLDFASIAPTQQDVLIQTLDEHPQLKRWFADLRADAAAAWVAHPATLARLNYSGIGVGGAHTPHRGFTQLGIGEIEPWEPR